MSQLLEKTDDRVITSPVEPGDNEKFSHYVRKTEILGSFINGELSTGLCGKQWVPDQSKPEKFPICPKCIEVYEGLKS